MALHINLYHEVDRAKRAKSRDPLKLSMFVLAFIASLFAIYYFVELGKLGAVKREYAQKKAEFDAVDPQARAAEQREQELATTIKTSETLVKRIEGRFYWAPVLERLARIVPREVQITKLGGDVQGENQRKATITLDGISAGSDPRKVAEELRTRIAEEFSAQFKDVSSTFRTLEDGVESVRIDKQQWPTATFAIVVQLSTGDQTPVIEPPARRKK